MLKRTVLAKSLLIAFGGTTVMYGAAFAQTTPDTTQPSQDLGRVVVTGSAIRRTDSETPSPVQVITSEDMKKSGYTSTAQILQTITANGQGTLSQGFSGAFASGAAGIALRGLNVGATLVLLDGHRMAPYPIGDDGQRSFVDISNIPFDSIERIEILKDGASAIYGSDAIAGVVNIILKRTVVGTTLTADLGSSYKHDGNTQHFAATFGAGDLATDNHNFYISGEYRKQNEIKFTDRPGLLTQTDFTGTGGYNVTPGVLNPIVGIHPRSATGYVTDASGAIAGFMPGCDATKLAAGQCTYHDTWSQIQPSTENVNLVTRFTQNLNADWQLSLQGTFFQAKAQQINGPSRAFTAGNPALQGTAVGPGVAPTLNPALNPTSIPTTNPSFPAGTGLAPGSYGLRYTFLDVGPNITDTTSRASRAIADLTGHLGAWDVNASLGFTQVLLDLTDIGVVNAGNLQTALDSTTNPYLVGGVNSPSVLSFIAPTLSSHDTSKLSFVHVGASRDLMDLQGGPLSFALGSDFVHRTQNTVAPAAVAGGFYNGQISNNFTVGTQNVASIDAELVAPVLKTLDLEGAIRYDHYNLSGGKASPKVGFKFTPIPEFAVRGTASKGFRAPGPAENGQSGQTFFAGTSSDPVLCPTGDPTKKGSFVTQCNESVPGLQGTNPALKPETSTSYTLGFIVEPVKNFSATIDLYSIQIDNQIVAGGGITNVRGTSLAPLDQVIDDNGTIAAVVPPVSPIAYQQTSYVNANTTKTQGVDLGFQWRHRFEGVGDFKSDLTISYTSKYDLTIDGTTYKLAGTHGPFFFSGDTGNPKTRIQWANTFAHGPWQVTGTINYISSFDVTDPSAVAFTGQPQDTCLNALTNSGGAAGTDYQGVLGNGQIPDQSMCRVHSFTTFDLSGRFDVTKQLSIHASILNLFNRTFPADWSTYGGALGEVPWNPSLHMAGAVGRFFNLGATYTF